MSRTVGVQLEPDRDVFDTDGSIPRELEALRQRITQALLLRTGEWFLNRTKGLNRDLILGHNVQPHIARAALDNAVRTEGGSEITAIEDSSVSIDEVNRQLQYSVTARTIWGGMELEETLSA